ncbi:2-succinyl-6-hydroxy-2,4-cyclohexadiene-1-carboxylate synthase [Pasteurellaceae bacterium LIM206]|nr:2-succinyl-6-hydroxy-2,4-cyclohexadiene-1-carboxylate synthase [Pasteurellaceae bacterium LIM206]
MINLIFLHGLLGTQADWLEVIEKLEKTAPHFRCISLDLPLHGAAKNQTVADFDDTAAYLARRIKSAVGNEPFFLVGYSLGGRIALYYALQAAVGKNNLRAVIVEGANVGLKTEQERKARCQNDEFWANRFSREPPRRVLNDWYRQPVFAHLTASQRMALIEKRAENCAANIGEMLRATSLAKQPYLGEKLRRSSVPVYYLAGEKDRKFRRMAQAEQIEYSLIPAAGHNAHLENPTAFAEKLTEIVQNSQK